MPTFTPLRLKPDLAAAAQRWEAFLAGELIDRPILCVNAPRAGKPWVPGNTYYQRIHDDIGTVIDRALASSESVYFGGDSVPEFGPSFGPDEIAAFCGGDLHFSAGSVDTNWSTPFVEDWRTALPIALQEEHPLWQRMRALVRRAAARLTGQMAMGFVDTHTNMDLLAAMRGPQQLCMDLVEDPDLMDEVMLSARAVFPTLWETLTTEGRMSELGFNYGFYAMDGAAVLQCDFSCMISPAMFNRWVMPALEEEAEIVKHAFYHWDGPDALVHADTLLASPWLHTFGYVPGDGNGRHVEHLEVFQRIQAAGKACHVWGSPDELKAIHRELLPNKVLYTANVGSEDEANALLDWFVANT